MQAAQALITRWSAERLRALSLDSIVAWQSMIQGHAEGVRQETELLRTQLSPVFKVRPTIVEAPRSEALGTVEEAADVLSRLDTLVTRQDGLIRVAFQPCAALPCEIPDATTLFRSFSALEIEAGRFSRFYLKLGSAPPQ